ncbi:uncharacterized protein LOC144324860 isoform X1 [Podarcis muralis]
MAPRGWAPLLLSNGIDFTIKSCPDYCSSLIFLSQKKQKSGERYIIPDYRELLRRPREVRAVAAGDYRESERQPQENRGLVTYRPASPMKVCLSEGYREPRMSAQQYEEEEVYGPRSGPSCVYGEKEPRHLEGQAPSYHPAPRYSHDQELRDVAPRCATREFSLWDLDLCLFPAYTPPINALSYLTLFELSCQDLGVPPRHYMIILRALVSGVSGELADLMGQVPLSYAMDYEHYKSRVLQIYRLRAEDYRRAFRKVDKAAATESLTLVAAKVAQNFDFWMSAEDVTTFEGMRQLMLKEQFNRHLPAELACLVADRSPATIEQAAQFAETFRLNRPHLGNKSQPVGSRLMALGSKGRSAFQPKEPGKCIPAVSEDLGSSTVLGDLRLFEADQRSDPSLQASWDAVESLPQGKRRARFLYEKGLLYRQFWPKKIKDKDVVLQLVVPGSRRPKVLDLAHHDGLAGHLGVQKTLERISRYFYWPDVHQSVKNFVRSCVVCQKIGNDKDSMPNTLQSVPLDANVLEKWGIDLVGPLQKTRAGKQYVCVIIDYASRYVWATSLPNTSAQNLAKALVLAFGSLGIPKVLVTDLGTNVMAELTQKVLQLAKVHHHTSVVDQHQGNGLIKRVQKTLEQMLRKCALAHGSSWDQDLPLVVSAYNDAYQRSLGFAPNQLIFGRLLNTPLSMLRREWEGSEEEIKVPSVSEYFANLRQMLSYIWQLAKENLEGARLEQKRFYDLKVVTKSFEVGDQVLVLKPTRPHKLAVKWHGPGIVKAKLSSVRYLVECQELHDASREYHVNSLKRYLESELSVLAISGGREEVPTAPIDLLEE